MVTSVETRPRLRAAPAGRAAGRAAGGDSDDGVGPRELAARTLLARPRPAPWFVSRGRLVDVLDSGAHLPLVLVSASAGTGKTSLVADWLGRRGHDRDTAWVTLGPPHAALWPLLLESLHRLGVPVPGSAGDPGDHLDAATLTSVAAALAARAQPVRIVIDGYEAAPAGTADDLDLLLRCAQGGLRLVIVTRVDPAFRLYRHRLEGSVLEVRDHDLGFDDDEAQQLLDRAGVVLSPASVHDLNARTRGWATGLRFAARALGEATAPEAAVAEVVANTTDINEYLLGEVLDAQPPELRRLLLTTSVPDTLFPDLVAELVGPGRPVGPLAGLNAFLEPVAGAPGCFHYHPFFRDLLRAQLAYEAPDVVAQTHRRTGTWLVRHGLLDAGVQHLAAAGCWELAAEAVVADLALVRLLAPREDDPLVRTLRDTAPPSGTAGLLVQAAVALAEGRTAESGRLLSAARDADPPSLHLVPRYEAAAAVLDAVRARECDPPARAAQLADRARTMLDRLGGPTRAEHPELLDLVTTCRGVAQLRDGALGDAARTLAGCAATAPVRSPVRWHALGYLALAEALEGHLSRAADNATLALEATDPPHPGRGVLQSSAGEVALAVVSLERLDIDAAETHLSAAGTEGDTSPACRALAAVTAAGVQESRGRVDRALRVLTAARADLPAQETWLARRLALETAQLQVTAGSADGVVTDLAGVQHEPEAAALAARVHLGDGRLEAAATCLDRVRDAEVPLHVRIDSILLEADREVRHGSPVRARRLLDRSLRLAAPERMRRPFAGAPTDVRQLLVRDPQLAPLATWLERRTDRSAADRRGEVADDGPLAVRVRPPAPPLAGELPAVVEPLTTKELEVLGHLEELLSTQEIAAAMFISVNTVRTHVRNILRKLGVTRRSAAVRRARQLQIV